MTERQPPAPLPTKASDEPEIEPPQFVVRENAQSEQPLDVIEASFEQSEGCCRTGIGVSTPERSACARQCAITSFPNA
jgi:hypothetical protein